VRNRFLYKIAALDSSYNKSLFSPAAITALPDVTAPGKPFIKKITSGEDHIIIEWLRLTDPDTKEITLFRRTSGDQTTVAVLNASAFMYRDSLAEAGIPHEYFLTAADSAGNISEISNVYTAVRVKTKSIASIDILEARYDSLLNEIILTWAGTTVAVTGFIVYRKEGPDEFRPVTGIIQSNEFLDRSVRKEHTYVYRIKAFDESGLRAESIPREINIE
jgi:hypothetical protein